MSGEPKPAILHLEDKQWVVVRTKPRGEKNYSATIVFEDSKKVIKNVEARSVAFPDYQFEVEDLDMDTGVMKIYSIKNGSIIKIKSR